jgi:diaminohydroxyphosphoribosylaminopyrimidine deaminase/5-amino-6-(5-phosphoribosylamino)uracil reductase
MQVTVTEQDLVHLRRALELAEGGRGRVSPNPLVGAILARDDAVIGEGFHAELGGLHAERAALEDARARSEDPAGATLYVTLEPCAHTGRQPPCTEAILEAGIARVVIGCDDPSAKASDRGPSLLRDAGVEVDFASGAEAAAARLLVQSFRKLARTGKPLVTYKVASTLDGKVAMPDGGARWISGAESRELVHRWRAEADAVAVGIGTALADDPLLTARDVGAHRQPLRVVFDRKGRLPHDSKLMETTNEAPLRVLSAPIGDALEELGAEGISDLLLEGGPTLASAFLDAGEIDEVRLFIAPVISGSAEAPGVFVGAHLGAAVTPLAVEHETVGPDLLMRARLREW